MLLCFKYQNRKNDRYKCAKTPCTVLVIDFMLELNTGVQMKNNQVITLERHSFLICSVLKNLD